jgi:hypothetical protein
MNCARFILRMPATQRNTTQRSVFALRAIIVQYLVSGGIGVCLRRFFARIRVKLEIWCQRCFQRAVVSHSPRSRVQTLF